MLKHSVATLGDGIELLLKARLEMVDWQLVFSKIDRANQADYERGEFHSVTCDEAVKRLEKHCSVVIPDSIKPLLASVRQLRNRIRHFGVDADQNLVKSLITKTLSFAIDFVSEEFSPIDESPIADEVRALRKSLGECKEFVRVRLDEISVQLASAFHLYLNCPMCLQKALNADGEGVQCLFCGYRCVDGEIAASEWVLRFASQLSPKARHFLPDVEKCPECSSESCIHLVGEGVSHVCLECGITGDFMHCGRCNELSRLEFRGDICDDCEFEVRG
jgi:hypothetical protein